MDVLFLPTLLVEEFITRWVNRGLQQIKNNELSEKGVRNPFLFSVIP